MATLEKKILITSDDIDRNIDQLLVTGRGFVSRNVLKQLRVLVEQIAVLTHLNDLTSEVAYHTQIIPALTFIKQQGQYRFLNDFYEKLNAVMHTSLTDEDADMLMINYVTNLFFLKKLCYEKYRIDILKNLKNYPTDLDPGLRKYYEEIFIKLKERDYRSKSDSNAFYIEKVKTLIINGEIFYEVTFRAARNSFSKYDKVVAFTKKRITTKYALKLALAECRVTVEGVKVEALLIIDFEIYIRPCEIMHLGRFFNPSFDYKNHTTEYFNLAKSMKQYSMSLLEIILLEDGRFENFLLHIQTGIGMRDISNLLISLRGIIYQNKKGSNILRYLLTNVSNVVIKKQFFSLSNKNLSNLHIKNGSIVFDDMPICSALLGHNPKITNLLECIPFVNREYEMTIRVIHQNTRVGKRLFVPIEELGETLEVTERIKMFNSKIWFGHRPNREIHLFKDRVYMYEVERKCFEIIKMLRKISSERDESYKDSVVAWLKNSKYEIDDDTKKTILLNMFSESQVAFVYGPAGTGKTFMIEHVSAYFSKYSKVYLTNTNSAKGNLESRIENKENTEFSTIESYLKKSEYFKSCDILIIDECSTISNDDFHQILTLHQFRKLVLVGDTFQIESIDFGNWFHITKRLIDKKCIYELDVTRRTSSAELKKYWSAVRDSNPKLLEQASLGLYSQPISNLFNVKEDDEIILSLNYDGLYGINNLNKLLQEKNENEFIEWGDVNKYKVNDPVVFSHVDRFFPILFNNLKGIIRNIEKKENEIRFVIEIFRTLHPYDNPEGHGVSIVDNLENDNTLISLTIHTSKTYDEDEDDNTTIVPFQVSYATSIHKAQGLEYKNVKIIVVNEVQEQITHSIFYTAITRSTKNLFLFWSSETAEKIYSKLVSNSDNDDVFLLKAKNSL
jgi:DNA replication protein DnaC